jgi:hypothetical protein
MEIPWERKRWCGYRCNKKRELGFRGFRGGNRTMNCSLETAGIGGIGSFAVGCSPFTLSLLPFFNPIQHMHQQGRIRLQHGMRKLAHFLHTDLLHNPLGRNIGMWCKGEYFFEAQFLKAVIEAGPGAFGSKTLAPIFTAEAPADLHTGSKGGLEGGCLEADEADECAGIQSVYGVEAEAVLPEMVIEPLY